MTEPLCSGQTDDFRAVTDDLRRIFVDKNTRYNNSFEQVINKYGTLSSVIRLTDKLNRLDYLVTHRTDNVSLEEQAACIEDAFKDIANYSIMTLMWIHKQQRHEKNTAKP